MSNRIGNSRSNRVQLKSLGAGLRAGMAKERLIFIIICSAAIAVAIITLAYSFKGEPTIPTKKFQCLDCDYEFTEKTTKIPPVECSKCGGQAAELSYRSCRECGEEVLISRLRAIQGEAQEQSSGSGMLGAFEVQYWGKQEDGSYGWTQWMSVGSPESIKLSAGLQCSKCGARFYR